MGYYKDDYISCFVRNANRKAPEINRGYFARVRGVEMCIEKMFQKTTTTSGGQCQIINLGCGFDSLYWRLASPVTNFVEVDFPTVTAKKCYAIKRNKQLLGKLHNEGESPAGPITWNISSPYPPFADGDIRLSPTDLHATNYHLIGVDLRNIDELVAKLKTSEVNFSLPTIFLAECVLVYMEPKNCFNLLRALAEQFPAAAFINYEQVNMNDRFGDVMLANLRARGCTLAGVESCLSLEAQMNRFRECGWHGAKAWDMVQVYNSLPSAERQRVERIEMLDERELLDQLFQHYCIAVAWTGTAYQNIDIT